MPVKTTPSNHNYIEQDDEPDAHVKPKTGKWRKSTTDLHPLWGGSKTIQADRAWRRDIPFAGDGRV